MKRRLVLPSIVLSLTAFGPSIAWAQLPTCADLATNPLFGLAGNPTVFQVNATTPLTTFVSTGAVPYCRVDFVVSERGGPEAGYAVGENQRVVLRVGLPANPANSGTGGAPGLGAWNGKVRNLGGGGLVGAVGAVTTATNARYVGSSTDSGHVGNNNTFGVIQATHELNLGKIEDFFSESLRLQYQWALRLAAVYYGTPATRNYWDGCSTGGRQGLVLAHKYGQDFDGFLIGAPHTNHVKQSTSGAFRTWTNKELAGGSVTDEKLAAFSAAAVSQCDLQDGVADNILSEPRTCKVSAAVNICGTPGAPTDPALCLTPTEANAIDIVMDGARNDKGARVWFHTGRGASGSMEVPANGLGGNGPFLWAKKDLTFDWVNLNLPRSEWDDLHELATNVVSPYSDMGSPNLDLARNNGAKILMWHGGADDGIPFRSNIYYYSRVLDYYGGAANVSPWFRFFLAPGVGHCGGGNGPQPQQLFNTMVAWAEGAPAPDSILASGGGRTRPLCPFPQTAIYDGVGNPNLASSFSCGGNIQTKEQICDGLIVKHQHETGTAYEPLNGEDDVSCGFASVPITTARVSGAAVKGWYHAPMVTLNGTDPDEDVVRTEYRLAGTSDWTTYAGPFLVSGDGTRTVEYRSVDEAEHVEATHSLALKIDATAPVTTATLSPAAVNGWYRQPTVTLGAVDPTAGVDRTKYSVDGARFSRTYTRPFRVSGDGNHTVAYRSVDKAGNVEATHSLAFKIDATEPDISGMPSRSCSIWPADNKLVQIANVKATDKRSGVAPGSLKIQVTSNERLKSGDIVVTGGVVKVRASRSGKSPRVYNVVASVSDLAGNETVERENCVVQPDQSHGHDGRDGHDDDRGHDNGKDRDGHR